MSDQPWEDRELMEGLLKAKLFHSWSTRAPKDSLWDREPHRGGGTQVSLVTISPARERVPIALANQVNQRCSGKTSISSFQSLTEIICFHPPWVQFAYWDCCWFRRKENSTFCLCCIDCRRPHFCVEHLGATTIQITNNILVFTLSSLWSFPHSDSW